MTKPRSLLTVLLALLLAHSMSLRATAQSRSVPSEGYYFAKRAYFAGDYRVAVRGLNRAARNGVRVGDVRWIDSICYYSMMGECFYQQGQLAASLEYHEQALKWFLTNQNWMLRIQFPAAIGPTIEPVRSRIGWGARGTIVGAFPDSMSSLQGSIDQRATFELGGVVDIAHLRSVDVVEVARCTALSLRRRAELLGPICPYTPLSSQLTNALSGNIAPVGHWSSAWQEVLYGLALIGEGQRKEGRVHLASGTLMAGYDHPLTGIALLELGKLALRGGEYGPAANLFLQASIAGAEYEQADLVDESFRYLTDAYLAGEGSGTYPVVQPAVLWAQSLDCHRLSASLLLDSAEIAVYANSASAVTLLDQAATIITRRKLGSSKLGGRFSYLQALTLYRAGNAQDAAVAMRAALTYMQASSFRLYQRGLVEKLHAAGRKTLKPRQAERLFSIVLREPEDNDWRTDPLETITSLLSPHNGSLEEWFELLVDRREYSEAVEVAEQLRRHRFYSTLPIGGRLLSLRWLVEGTSAILGKDGIEQQKRLRTKYPELAKNSLEAEKVRLRLRAMPAKPVDKEQSRTQRSELQVLAKLSLRQENILREIALRREPAKLVFPPQPALRDVTSKMRRERAFLMFVTTQHEWHAWFIRRGSAQHWTIKNPVKVRRSIAALLRSLGNRERNGIVDAEKLNDSWKEPAADIWKNLIGTLPSGGWDELQELVIIPDGPLWYLPFEVLQVPQDQLPDATEDRTLHEEVRIRYSPTLALAGGDLRGHNPKIKTTLVAGQLFPRESSEPAQKMLEKLKENLPEVEVIASAIQGPSALHSASWERLLVWDDIDQQRQGPYEWAPAQFDRGKAGSRLSDWIEYPWGAPDQVLLPGFHTAAEGVLTKQATGYEVFLSVCGMMSTGTRTMLLSRWRLGGSTPAMLIREFASELPEETASLAWQRAVDLVRAEQLNPETEPRIRGGEDVEEVSADHPFFWAGYMLVDTGALPEKKGVPEALVDAVPDLPLEAEADADTVVPPADPVPPQEPDVDDAEVANAETVEGTNEALSVDEDEDAADPF